MKEVGDVTSSDWEQRGWAWNPVKTKIAVQAGVYKCLLPFICFSYGVYLSVLVTCYAYIVYNTHITEDSWINTQDSTRPRASERNWTRSFQSTEQSLRSHTHFWSVINATSTCSDNPQSWNVYFCKIVTNSKIKRTRHHSNRRYNNLKWAKDKGRFVYHVHLSHHRGAKSWFQSRVTS